jgi:hypothetical protein
MNYVCKAIAAFGIEIQRLAVAKFEAEPASGSLADIHAFGTFFQGYS